MTTNSGTADTGAGASGTDAGAGASGAAAGATDGKTTGQPAAGAEGSAGAADAGKQGNDGKAGAVDDGKGKEGEGGKAAEGAPVDYATVMSEVPMPEGMTLDPAAAKIGGELFAKHGISAEAAKDLVALYAQQQKAGADGNAKAFADQVSGWKADAEKGTTPQQRGTAKEAALAIFGKDEVALLEHFGVTNRAGFIKAMAKVGEAIGNDKLVLGNADAGSGQSRSRYPNSNMNP